MITDYASLKTAIVSWSNRDDLASMLGDFIQLGEIGMYNALRSAYNERTNTGVLSNPTITLPGDYTEMIQLTVSGKPLERVSPQKMSFLQVSGGSEQQPVYFTREQRTLKIFPFLGGAEYSLLYWGTFPSLSDANPTNDLLQAHPELFLWFSLVELAVFLGDEGNGARWSAQAKRAVDALNEMWMDETISGSSQHINMVGGDYGS